MMKRKNFIILVLLIITLSTLQTGCKKSIEEKLAEKFFENETGGKVDINKDSTTIKTEGGEIKAGEGEKWPADKMGDLPSLDANIVMVVEDFDKEQNFNMIMLYFDKLKKEEAKKYVESIKELNYEPLFETYDGDDLTYSGRNAEGAEILFAFTADGSGSIFYSDKQYVLKGNSNNSDPSSDSSSSKDVDMTDDAEWPANFFDDIPELKGKITQVYNSSEQEKYVYFEHVKKDDALDYIDILKNIGFTKTPSEYVSGNYLNYEASNKDGDYMVFDWSDDESASIVLLKDE